jgi:lysozyme
VTAGVDFKVLTKWLELDEGCKLKPYYCTAGKLTIGVGRNLEDTGITRAEAQFMLEGDIVRLMKELDELFPEWRDLSETRQMVVLNMCFNMGTFGFLNFKRTIAYMRAEEFSKAADEMLRSQWADQVGDRAKRLSDAMREDKPPI